MVDGQAGHHGLPVQQTVSTLDEEAVQTQHLQMVEDIVRERISQVGIAQGECAGLS